VFNGKNACIDGVILSSFQLITVLSLTTIVSASLTGLYYRVGSRADLLDHPNHRSSHTKPTVRGAGVVILVSYAVLLIITAVTNHISNSALLLFLAPLIIGVVGFLDDRFNLGSLTRMVAYSITLGAGLLFFCWPHLIAMTGLAPALLYMAILLLLGVWSINLFNFMDGINGIASFEAIFILATLLWIVFLESSYNFLLAGTIGAIAGFLLWNFPRAKVFMGDAGSTFLGALIFVTGIYAVIEYEFNPAIWFILYAVFFGDASYTLFRRMVSGQQWFQAHRSHAYQILARRWDSHAQACRLLIIFNLLFLLPVAWLTLHYRA